MAHAPPPPKLMRLKNRSSGSPSSRATAISEDVSIVKVVRPSISRKVSAHATSKRLCEATPSQMASGSACVTAFSSIAL